MRSGMWRLKNNILGRIVPAVVKTHGKESPNKLWQGETSHKLLSALEEQT